MEMCAMRKLSAVSNCKLDMAWHMHAISRAFRTSGKPIETILEVIHVILLPLVIEFTSLQKKAMNPPMECTIGGTVKEDLHPGQSCRLLRMELAVRRSNHEHNR